jgi:hypothetical protein
VRSNKDIYFISATFAEYKWRMDFFDNLKMEEYITTEELFPDDLNL